MAQRVMKFDMQFSKNLTEKNLEDLLKRVAWARTKWDKMPTGKYKLFLHNLNMDTKT